MKVKVTKPFALHTGKAYNDVGIDVDLPDEDAKALIRAGFVKKATTASKPAVKAEVEKRTE